jgi:hypothetical protein
MNDNLMQGLNTTSISHVQADCVSTRRIVGEGRLR